MPKLRIGCSGFNYKHWKGVFYPEKLPQKRWFEHYSSIFSTVELNVTFYRLPNAETFEKWRNETPEHFDFAIKGSRFISHIKRLVDPEESLKRYFDNAVKLGGKLQVVLWQFAPSFAADPERLSRFLELLDRYPVRQAFEFRHESWISDETVRLCRDHNAAMCMAEWPQFNADLPLTADFVYIRRHGYGGDHSGRFSREYLAGDADRIRKFLNGGRDVFVYFNNDVGGAAPDNARELREILAAD